MANRVNHYEAAFEEYLKLDPKGDKVPNVVMLNGPNGKFPPTMPKAVTLPCNTTAKALHFLSGVSGWGYPYSEKGSITMIVRLHYADGQYENHELKNGEQFADYIRRVDVPGSKFAFALRGQQIRYFTVTPKRDAVIKEIELIKGLPLQALSPASMATGFVVSSESALLLTAWTVSTTHFIISWPFLRAGPTFRSR